MMKLLIVKLHALGDLVIATPAIRRLRTGLKDARIDLLTTEWSAPAMEGNPNLDRLIVVDDAIFFNPGIGTFIPTVRLIGKLRREKYDAAVIFHQHRFIKLFVKMTGISKRFGFGEEDNNKFVRRHPSAGDPPAGGLSTAEGRQQPFPPKHGHTASSSRSCNIRRYGNPSVSLRSTQPSDPVGGTVWRCLDSDDPRRCMISH